MEKFGQSVTFEGSRYVVGLLWRAEAAQLQDNSEVALRRLRALRRRLDKSVDTAREYAAVIQTYLDHGWAEPVEEIGGPPKLGSLATSLLGGPRLSSGQKMHQSLHHLPEARRSPVLSDDERPSA
ncbi:Solute carrier family 12 member [Trichinella pseudospiralis]